MLAATQVGELWGIGPRISSQLKEEGAETALGLDRFAKGSLKIGSSRVGEAPRGWTAKQERRTPAYTTDWQSMPMARA